MKKQRLDDYLIAHGLVRDKDEAFIVVTEGWVLIEGQKAVSPAQGVGEQTRIEMREERKYVGRGARKLEAALDAFGIDPQGSIAIDIGAATGGFTEMLLRRGAAKVYAIDTARGKLAFKLRHDPRVVVMEEADIRHVPGLPEKANFVTIDVSLLSLRDILPHVPRFIGAGAIVVALFKPQYEARGSPALLRHGIVVNDEAREGLINDFLSWCRSNNWIVNKTIESPIRGNKGNKEYLILLKIKQTPPFA